MQNSVNFVNKDIHHRAETKTNLRADESKKNSDKLLSCHQQCRDGWSFRRNLVSRHVFRWQFRFQPAQHADLRQILLNNRHLHHLQRRKTKRVSLNCRNLRVWMPDLIRFCRKDTFRCCLTSSFRSFMLLPVDAGLQNVFVRISVRN